VISRGRRQRAALAAVLLRDDAPELRLMREWLDNWSGPGLIIAGMTHQGWDVQLAAYAAHDWRAIIYRSVDSRRTGHIGRAERRRIKSLRARKRQRKLVHRERLKQARLDRLGISDKPRRRAAA
jgi:hypothetical protein